MDEQDNKILGELLKRLADGDRSAIGEIAEKIEKILKAIGNIYYRNRADIEDAISNLYLKLMKNANKFHSNDNASAWIIKIFENGIRSHLRSIRREQEYIQENGAELLSSNQIDEKYIENHLFIREVFEKLMREERRLIIYYYWCHFSIREIADILHKSKSAIDRALKKLEEKAKKNLE